MNQDKSYVPATGANDKLPRTRWTILRVALGTIVTEGFSNYSPAGRASFYQANPMLRSGDPWDVAEAIAYLSSDAGKFVTGETLNVDGGAQSWGDPWFAGRPPYFEPNYDASRLGATETGVKR